MISPRFFPFNPRSVRLGLLGCALLGAALTGFAGSAVRHGGGSAQLVRLMLLAVLTVASGLGALRLSPRADWGVSLDDLGLTLARPLGGPPVRLSWREISRVSRGGKRGETLIVYAEPEGRVEVGRQLFASGQEFDELSDALLEKKPPKLLDA